MTWRNVTQLVVALVLVGNNSHLTITCSTLGVVRH